MKLLLTAAAYKRVERELSAFSTRVQPILLDEEGALITPEGGALAYEGCNVDFVWASADAYLAGSLRRLLKCAVDSRTTSWVQTFSAGIDDPVFASLLGRGVRVSRSDAQAGPIAEYVLAHALSLIVPIAQQATLQAGTEWRRTPYTEVAATRWLIVGYGGIGQEIARRARSFGCHLTVVRRRGDQTAEMADRTIPNEQFVEAVPEADVIILACPLNPDTRHIAGEHFFQALKPGALLINIGRGGLVDEQALRAGLERDQPAQAVLDVFQTEPLPTDHWLWCHPKVRVTAHTAASGSGTLARGDKLFLANLENILSNKPLANEASVDEVNSK